eukprot:NODE_6_length_48303_cov_0.387022.p6 type:complete len:788 gc:universal NODE_6_length_48303_cov_0.387022:34251-31888(-)
MFFISTPELRQPSRKPKHLSIRFENKPSGNADVLAEVTARRIVIIHERTEAIRNRFEEFSKRVRCKQLEHDEYVKQLVSDLSRNMSKASKSKSLLLQKIVSKVEKDNKKAKQTVEKTLLENSEKIKELEQSIVTKDMITYWRRSQLKGKCNNTTTIKHPMKMASNIQWFWFYFSSKAILTDISATLQGIDTASFEDLTFKINDPGILQLCSKFSKALKMQKDHNFERIFLSALIVKHHPEKAFVSVECKELKLQNKARVLFDVFEGLVSCTNPKCFQLYSNAFKHVWNQYKSDFESWKVQDKKEMIELMISHFVELSRMWNSVQGEPNCELEWRPKLVQQQNHILLKLKAFAGKQGLRRLHLEMKKECLVKVPKEPTTPPAPTIHSRPLKTPESPVLVHAIPKVPIDTDKQYIMKGNSINFNLAHKIMVDPDFKFKANKETYTQLQLRSFINNYKSLSDCSGLINVLSVLKTNLMQIVPHSGHYRALIDEVMDIEILQNTPDPKAFVANRLGPLNTFVVSIMGEFCAPSRDAQISAIGSVNNELEKLEMISSVLDELKLDLANFHAQALRGTLKDHVISYERDLFAQNNETLDMAVAWLQSYKQVDSSFGDIFDNAFNGLFFDEYNERNLPETFSIDADVIFEIRNTTAQLVKKCLFFNLLKAHMTFDDRPKVEEISRLIGSVDGGFKTHAMTILSELNVDMDNHVIEKLCDSAITADTPIYSIINRRVKTIYKEALKDGKIKSSLKNFGLQSVDVDLQNVCKKLFYLYKHNKRVYCSIYDEILRRQ